MRLSARSLVAAAAFLLAAGPLAAQTITGRVVDAASGAPVPQAVVTALDARGRGAARARAGADGSFELRLRAAGTYRLRGERSGYRQTLSQELEADDRETVEVDLRLSVQPIAIEPMTVTARRQPRRLLHLEMGGFYRRQKMGLGHFLDREDFERHPTDDLANAIDRVPGTHLLDGGPGRRYVYFERSLGVPGRGICFPLLYVDGVRVFYARGSGFDINHAVPAGTVEAVEIYKSAAEIPVEYNGSEADCGVIVVWTRSGP